MGLYGGFTLQPLPLNIALRSSQMRPSRGQSERHKLDREMLRFGVERNSLAVDRQQGSSSGDDDPINSSSLLTPTTFHSPPPYFLLLNSISRAVSDL